MTHQIFLSLSLPLFVSPSLYEYCMSTKLCFQPFSLHTFSLSRAQVISPLTNLSLSSPSLSRTVGHIASEDGRARSEWIGNSELGAAVGPHADRRSFPAPRVTCASYCPDAAERGTDTVIDCGPRHEVHMREGCVFWIRGMRSSNLEQPSDHMPIAAVSRFLE